MLVPECVPILKDLLLSFEFGSEVLTLAQLVPKIAQIKLYGLFDATSSKQKNSCPMWEVHEQYLQHELVELVRARGGLRESAQTALNFEYKKLLGVEAIPIISEEVIEAIHPVTPKKQRGRPAKEPSTSIMPGQKQLSSFFTVIKKSASTEGNTEYFQPFQLKENSIMAPINYFSDYMMMSEEDTQQEVDSVWTYFRKRCKKSPLAWKGKPQSTCVGWDEECLYFTSKLLQFHENYRPAYFGSLNKLTKPRVVNGRRPFAKEPEFDYEYDSDDDWCEEEDINDAESILSEDEEEDDLEEDSTELDEEETEWLVPEGQVDRDAVVESETDMPTFKRQSYKRGQKKRYIQLQPQMHGPYINNGIDMATGIIGSFKTRILIPKLDPFEGTYVPDVNEDIPRVQFLESHLTYLAILSNMSTLGVAKLYELFSQKHGRVSKKQFELRLYQIAEKTKNGSGKATWTIRPEYQKLLIDDVDCMVVDQVHDVAMADV